MTWAPECPVRWDALNAAILLFAIPLAIVITSLTIILYRKSVEKAMRFSAGRVVPARAPANHPNASSTPLSISFVHDQAGPITPQMAHSRAAMRAAADFFELRYKPGFGELFLLWALNALLLTMFVNRTSHFIGLGTLFVTIGLVGSFFLGGVGLGCLLLSTRNTSLLSSMYYLLAGLILLFFTATWWSFCRLVRHYQAKGYSDQMLIVDSLWLLFTLVEALGQMGTSGVASLTYLLAFAAYKSVSVIGLRRMQTTQAADTPQALLMLRVFGFTSRTRQLTNQVGRYWRYSGPINIISGADLAISLIEPDKLSQFWSRKLPKAFITNDADLQARLDTLDVGRDPDLRYRINECFCHDNTWQATVKALAQRSAVVLMDLRGFGKKNRGCEFELEMLFEEVPISRVVLLVDRTTELESLKQVLQSAWDKLSESSPNHALTEPVIHLFQVEDSGKALQPLLSRLFAAAAAA
jgi:PII-like signaling protein